MSFITQRPCCSRGVVFFIGVERIIFLPDPLPKMESIDSTMDTQ